MLGRLLAGAMAGALAAVLLAYLLPPIAADRIRVAADCDGGFAAVALQWSADSLERFGETWADLLGALAPATERIVLCRDEAEWRIFLDFLARQGLSSARCRPVFTGAAITPWCHDRYVLCRRERVDVLLAPLAEPVTDPRRQNEFAVPDALAAALPRFRVERPEFRFDGGDFTASASTLFAGGGLAAKNNGGRFRAPAALKAELAALTGMKVIVLGESGEVPTHHIGMFVTPVDDSTVLVADPALGEAFRESLPLVLRRRLDFSPRVKEQFVRLQSELRAAGFDLVRVPILPLEGGAAYVTYNNVLMEKRNGKRIVYLPVYGFSELDRAAAAIYAGEGFTVKPIRVSGIYELGGAVRCVVNVVKRIYVSRTAVPAVRAGETPALLRGRAA